MIKKEGEGGGPRSRRRTEIRKLLRAEVVTKYEDGEIQIQKKKLLQ